MIHRTATFRGRRSILSLMRPTPRPTLRRPRSLASGLLAVVAAACHPVHIETLARPSSADSSSARLAVRDERSLAGRPVVRHTISVVPFQVSTVDTAYAPLGYGFAELLLSDLAVSHQLDVLERMHLEDAQHEIALSAARRTDATTAVRGGRLVAAQQLVVGSLVVPEGNGLTFSSSVADVGSGAVRRSLAGDGEMDHVFKAERELALRLFTELGVKLNKAEQATLDAQSPPNMKAFLAFSRGVQAEAHGQLEVAAASYREAVTLDPTFRLAFEHQQHVLGRQARAVAPAKDAKGGPTKAKDQAAPPAKRP